MRLIFKSATSNDCLSFDTKTQRYTLFYGIGSNAIYVKTNKELKALEIELIRGGYQKV